MRHRAPGPLPNRAKRMECVQLTGAFGPPNAYESGSKLDALHTLREAAAASILFDPVESRGFRAVCHAECVQRRGRADGGRRGKDETLAQISSVLDRVHTIGGAAPS